jgi:NADP-dependent 3-hydroxy acid dehydrogenase YdfG
MQEKIAVITGASGGIGSAISQKLGDLDYKVILTSRSADKLKSEELPDNSIIVTMDVGDNHSVSQAFNEIREQVDHIDVLVNCAGIMPLSYMKNRHLEEWLETIEVNVKGTLRCIHEVLPSMTERKKGHIVNIASVDGKEPYPGGAVYGASKAALITLTNTMRMELSPEYNIRLTAIEPGTVDTNLRDDITDEELLADKNYGNGEAMLKPEHIAEAVAYAVQQPQEVNINELLIKPTGKS